VATTRIERHIRAPRAAVYRALLDTDAVEQWMVPDGMSSRVHQFDAVAGGEFRVSLTYDEPTAAGKTDAHTDTFHGRFVRLVPDTEVVQVVEFETDEPAFSGEMTITYLLAEAADGGTDLTGVHENLPAGVRPEDNELGWTMSIDKLARLVEGRFDTGPELHEVAARLRAAIESGAVNPLGDVLDLEVTWNGCAGRDEVVRTIETALAETAVSDLSIEVAADRLLVSFLHEGSADGDRTVHQALFVREGRIVEIRDVGDRQHALTVEPLGPLAAAASRRSTMQAVAPVFPVRDVAAAIGHYRSLGFDVRAYEGDAAYAFAGRDSVSLHLAEHHGLVPASNSSAVYLYVSDADALYAQWRTARPAGRLVAPVDTEYGLREGAHVDPDGNLLRFGSPLGDQHAP
jgi:uncharacterized protein YndB with AHSA1/START domain